MDRATFDRERLAVQDALREMGQEIEIPDPDTPEYLSTFLTLERSHPRLAAQLAAAERADPAELLDPYTPRASKITPKHRLNAFLEKNFMRRGLDRKLVMDRQRVFRTTLYVTGGLLVGGLVWSVVAPKPSAAAQTAQTPAVTGPAATAGTAPAAGTPTTGGDTSGAFAPLEGQEEAGTSMSGIESAPAGEAAFATNPPDSEPRPVSASSARSNTPPPPEVFNQVTNDPYAPAPASTPVADPAPLAVDSAPMPVVSAPAPAASAPFGGAAAMASDPAPVTTIPAPEPERSPPLSPFADSSVASTPEVAAPFGGEVVTAPPVAVAIRTPTPPRPTAAASRAVASSAPTASAAQQEDPPARGAALIYQAPRNETAPSASRSALIYQSPRQTAAQDAQTASRSAMIYQGSRQAGAQAAAPQQQNAMIYQASAKTSGTGGSSLVYQGQGSQGVDTTAAPSPAGETMAQATGATPAFGQAVDPEAPRFAPTSVIAGKLFTSIRAAAGMAVPVVVLSQDGNWVGSATYNTRLGRVDMRFTSFVMHKNSKVYPVFATAYQRAGNGALSEGVAANVHPIAPTLALDLARAGLNGLNAYAQALQNAGTTSYNGSLVTTTRQAPELVQVLRGEVGKVFALPEGNQSIQIVADIAAGTEVQLVYGVGSEQQEVGLP